MTTRKLPKYVTRFRDRHKVWRYRFRMKGRQSYYFKAKAFSEEFYEEYSACMRGLAAPKLVIGKDRIARDSITYLVHRYYSSPEFLGLAESTKQTYRNQLNRFCAAHGDKPVRLLRRRHISIILGEMIEVPGAANSLLARLKLLLNFAVQIEMIPVNPIVGMKGFKKKTKGFHSWTDKEITKYLDTHPTGTRARLALALHLYTGQRRSDVVRMGWENIDEGYICFTQQKTGAYMELPILEQLQEELDLLEYREGTFLKTNAGKPFSAAGFGNWFREQCDAASLSHCTSHGLRKAAARRLAEAGRSNQEIKAVTGHQTDAEVNRYTRGASQRKLATQAMSESKSGTEMSNPSKKVRHEKD